MSASQFCQQQTSKSVLYYETRRENEHFSSKIIDLENSFVSHGNSDKSSVTYGPYLKEKLPIRAENSRVLSIVQTPRLGMHQYQYTGYWYTGETVYW